MTKVILYIWGNMIFWPFIFSKSCDYDPFFGARGVFPAILKRKGPKL